MCGDRRLNRILKQLEPIKEKKKMKLDLRILEALFVLEVTFVVWFVYHIFN